MRWSTKDLGILLPTERVFMINFNLLGYRFIAFRIDNRVYSNKGLSREDLLKNMNPNYYKVVMTFIDSYENEWLVIKHQLTKNTSELLIASSWTNWQLYDLRTEGGFLVTREVGFYKGDIPRLREVLLKKRLIKEEPVAKPVPRKRRTKEE